jgi:outer membrane protein assembly factor BamB
MAFPNEPRQQFDTSYEPVYAAGTIVVGSPVDGSIRAYAAENGDELWVHYTEGPVRLAPVIHDGRVLAGSDDGTFRCLDLRDGTLLWRLNAFPEDRPDKRLLGNNRLISLWPVRGGPAVVDNTVYFGAGAWPTMGVAVYAVDIATGKVLWRNTQISYLDHVRIDHNELKDAGATPQGYIAAADDHLVVANGRSQPVGINRRTGALFHFVQGYRNGDCNIALGGNYAFVGDTGIVSLVDFREVGSKWIEAGDNAPNRFDGARFDQFEGPYHSYKRFPGCDATSVFDGNTAYSLVNGILYAHDLAKAALSEYAASQGGRTLKPYRWDAPMTMRVVTGRKGQSRLFAKAGNLLLGRAGNSILAIALTGEQPAAKVAWSIDTESLPTSMIAADGRLVVATQDGRITCYAAGTAQNNEIKTASTAPPELNPQPSDDLRTVLDHTPARDGFFVVLGALSPGEADALIAETNLRVLAVMPDSAAVNALRRRYADLGLYGDRIEVLAGQPQTFELPPYLASTLWLHLDTGDTLDRETLERLWQSVRPYGGILCVTGSTEVMADTAALLQQSGLDGAEPRKAVKACLVAARPDGPDGAADWTHETADPARSHFSHDEAVTTPMAPVWFGDGPDYGFIKRKDYGRGVKPQVVHGRVFALQQFSRTLFAYDAYTGRHLWKQRDTEGNQGFITRFVSRPEGVYAAGKGTCVVYDPATGREMHRIDYRQYVEDNPVARASGVVVTDTSVLLAVSDIETVAIEQGLWDAETLLCFDRTTRELRWKRQAEERFNIKALAADNETVFCTDSMSPLTSERWKRRGEGVSETVSTIRALDEETGDVKWQATFTAPYRQFGASSWLSVRGRDDWLAYSAEEGRLLAGRERVALLLDAESGAEIWRKDLNLSQPIVVMGDRFMDQGARIMDLATGEVLKGGLFQRGGCNYAVANPNLAFLRDRTVCFVDLQTGEQSRLRNMRSGCSNSIIPASGVLSIPNFAQGCVCNYPMQTSSAWIHAPGVEAWGGTSPVEVEPVRLETGIPTVTAEQAEAMHEFKRRFLVSDPTLAEKHLLGHWNFDVAVPDKTGVLAGVPPATAPCRLSNPAFEPHGDGKALACDADRTETLGRADLGPPGTIADAVTLAAWIKLDPEQHKGAAGVVERPQFYRLMVEQTKAPYSISFSVQLENKSWRGVSTPRTIKPGEWNHVAGVYDSETGGVTIYLNGKRVGSSSGVPGRLGNVSATIDIGVRDGGAYLAGAVDDVRVYNRALAPALIADMAAR